MFGLQAFSLSLYYSLNSLLYREKWSKCDGEIHMNFIDVSIGIQLVVVIRIF